MQASDPATTRGDPDVIPQSKPMRASERPLELLRAIGLKGCFRAACGVCLMMLLGCSSGPAPIQQAHQAFLIGQFDKASEHLAQTIDDGNRDADVAKLELAVVELTAGNAAAADRLLRQSRDLFDARDTSEVLLSPRALLADDRERPYDTAGYEDVMIRSLLSIASLLSGSGDAEAYAIQAQQKQLDLARRAEEKGLTNLGDAYQPLALSPYVRGIIRESNHRDYDDAQRAYQLVAEWQPDFRFKDEDLQRASTGTHSQPGHGVLYVFAFVGRGPIRVQDDVEASGEALLIADRIVQAATGDAIPPTLAPIPIPRVVIPKSLVQSVGVRVNGVAAGTTARLTDVGEFAIRQFEAEMPWMVARGVARRVAKKAIVTTSTKSLGVESKNLQTGLSLVGSLWEATEKADTRCWSLLPREIQVLRVELPEGDYQVSASALGAGRELDMIDAQVAILSGRNSYVLVTAPETHVTSMCVGNSGT